MKQDKVPGEIQVTQAFLHQAVMWPGVINTEKTLGKIPGLKMTLTPQGLRLESKKAVGLTAIVPSANIALLIFKNE